MPPTPLHPILPWIVYVRWPRSLSFWALSVGSMVNDLEYLIAWPLTGDLSGGRGIMHSILGVLTINAILAVLIVRFLVPRVLAWAARRWPESPEIFLFAGQDLRRDPRDWLTLYTCAAFGSLTHLLIDLPTHAANPLWWPWQQVPLTLLPFADDLWWDALAGIPVLAAFASFLWRYWRR